MYAKLPSAELTGLAVGGFGIELLHSMTDLHLPRARPAILHYNHGTVFLPWISSKYISWRG